MELPFFYIAHYEPGAGEVLLDDNNSKHVVQVLRMGAGERLRLTDGRGALLDAVIAEAHKKKCRVRIEAVKMVPAQVNPVTIGISLVKNASRFEWFLEKAAEMGVAGIVPLLCERTERQHFRLDRMQQILVSAMLQSQQCWLPVLTEPQAFDKAVQAHEAGRAFIAHCMEEERTSLTVMVSRLRLGIDAEGEGTSGADGNHRDGGNRDGGDCGEGAVEGRDAARAGGEATVGWRGEAKGRGEVAAEGRGEAKKGWGPAMILIGPEGDFSPKEIALALARGFMPVMLGETRLRTETAGVVAAALLCIE